MAQRIAVASSDGKKIDLHFGQAYRFYIYDIQDSNYVFVGIREKSGAPMHDESEFDRTLTLLNDCTSVFVGLIGLRAARYLASKGMRVFEAPYPVEAVLNKILAKKILKKNNI